MNLRWGIEMQEIDWDGKPGRRIEAGDVKYLFDEIEKSIKDPNVQSVVIRKLIPSKRRKRLPKED